MEAEKQDRFYEIKEYNEEKENQPTTSSPILKIYSSKNQSTSNSSNSSSSSPSRKTVKKEKKENIRNQCAKMFFKKFYKLLNHRCKRYKYSLTKINFQKIFGNSIRENRAFIKRAIRTILSIKNSNNQRVIYKMIHKKKDRIFEALVKLRYKEAYNLFIQNYHFIKIKNYEFHLSHYLTLNECINEKKLTKGKLFNNDFENIAKKLIIDIEGKGKLFTRRSRKFLFRKKIYKIRYNFGRS